MLVLGIVMSQYTSAGDFNLPVNSNTNDNPFVQIHGLQGFSGVNLLDKGKFATRLMLVTSNEFYQQVLENEQLNLDFERTTLSFDLAYGFTGQWTGGLKIPYMINSGGFLDGLIEDWHDLFSLPQGGRDEAAPATFKIAYNDGDESLIVDDTEQGIGDVSVYADTLVYDTSSRKVKARIKIKTKTAHHNSKNLLRRT